MKQDYQSRSWKIKGPSSLWGRSLLLAIVLFAIVFVAYVVQISNAPTQKGKQWVTIPLKLSTASNQTNGTSNTVKQI